MNIKNIKHTLRGLLFMGVIGMLVASCMDNDFEDNTKGTFYTSTKITAAEFIDNNLDRFSSFKTILEKGKYFSTLATYGQYTFFLPDNNAVNEYLHAHGLNNLDQLSPEICDTLSRSHIINKTARFTTDDDNGTLMNMDDHFIVFSSEKAEDGGVRYIVNQTSQIIERDDSVTNGVVHVVNRMIASTNDFLPDYIKGDTAVSIFYDALKATGLDKLMTRYLDETYTISADSIDTGSSNDIKVFYGNHDHSKADASLRYPDKRLIKFTLFMEPNSVMRKNGINNLPQLITYAKTQYDRIYPEDAHIDDVTDRRNSLNRFIAYHMMDRAGSHNDWAPSGQIFSQCWKSEITDAEDFWETMCPGQIIRFSRIPGGDLYANSTKGREMKDGVKVAKNATINGVKVNPDPKINPDAGALNGNYLYLEGMLVFNPDRLNVRMRIDGTTLSPDFMNQGARGNYLKHTLCMFKNAYVGNFKLSEKTIIGVHNDDPTWSSYLGNAICIKGRFDMTFKLPPVPKEGLYEIRLGYVARGNGSIMQVYLDNEPCGIPFNQKIYITDSRVGWEKDKTTDDGLSKEECLLYNKGIDKTMRNHGYMCPLDCYGKSLGGPSFRASADQGGMLRRILVSNKYLRPTGPAGGDGHHWLRFRKVDNVDEDSEFSFDYIEIVPADVYNDPNGEDQH